MNTYKKPRITTKEEWAELNAQGDELPVYTTLQKVIVRSTGKITLNTLEDKGITPELANALIAEAEASILNQWLSRFFVINPCLITVEGQQLANQFHLLQEKYNTTYTYLLGIFNTMALQFLLGNEFGRANDVRGDGFLDNNELRLATFRAAFKEKEPDGVYSQQMFQGLMLAPGINYNPVIQGAKNAFPPNPNHSYEHALTHLPDTSRTWYYNVYRDENNGC